VPDLADGDLSLFTILRKSFPAWFLGVIDGAGVLTAMVPASIIISDRCHSVRQESLSALRYNPFPVSRWVSIGNA
jgi:SSS family solute:Na+ symporter